jgi:hypothetical protein
MELEFEYEWSPEMELELEDDELLATDRQTRLEFDWQRWRDMVG